MDAKQLLFQFIHASTEVDVTNIIKNNPVLSDDKNWRPYGNANNIGTITGQNPEAVPSLSEKITNSLDALLIKACIESGEEPSGESSPKTMEEALKRYFGLNEQKYEELSDKKRRELAERVQVIAVGSRENPPNIVIYDDGEGQHPQKFPNTFLSLGGDNKRKIYFVQGKYNMGGAAVLPFCGDQGETGYQLILSKKNLSSDNSGKFGFTLLRRNWGEGQHIKSSWYEYFVDSSGSIFEFDSEPLDIGLLNRKFDGGTYIKLFNYDLPKKSDITLDLWRDLNRYIYKSALPIIVYEGRGYGGKSPSKVMHGNRMRARLDDRNNVAHTISMDLSVQGQKYPVEVFVFQKEVNVKEFIGNMAVVFTVNGQVQHYIDKRFISGKAKKAYLKDSLLVSVDCSNITQKLHERLFMSSRANMRDTSEYREICDSLAKELADNELLKKIDNERQRDAVYRNPKDEEFLKNIMGKLLRDDKDIEKLLGLKGGIIGNETEVQEKDTGGKNTDFRGQKYPSIFKFSRLADGSQKMLPQNGECKIQIETDVEDEYLIRSHEKGELQIKIGSARVRAGSSHINSSTEDEEVLEVNRVGPNNGQIQLRIKPKVELPVGTEIPIDITMSSPEGALRLMATIKIDKPHEKSEKTEVKNKKQYSLPALIQFYKERPPSDESKSIKIWADGDPQWTEQEICRVLESSGTDCLVDAVELNMDAKELHAYIKSKKITGKNIENVKRSYKTSIYLLTIIIFNELTQRKKKMEDSKEKYSVDHEEYDASEMTAFIMNGMAKILLHITTNEGLLKESDE